MMICPLCGSSEFSWSYERGEVTCRRCGLVIEPIVESPVARSESHGSGNEWVAYRKFVYSKEKSYDKFVELKSRIGNREELYIDSAAFQAYVSRGSRRGLRLISSTRNSKAYEALRGSIEVREIMEKVVMKHPLLASRTVRGRIAAAYVLSLLLKGEKPAPKDVSRKTGVSMTQAKRIIQLIENERPRITNIIKQ